MSSISSGIDGSCSINITISFEKVEIVVGEPGGRMDQSGGRAFSGASAIAAPGLGKSEPLEIIFGAAMLLPDSRL
jgi:hypothetical protein